MKTIQQLKQDWNKNINLLNKYGAQYGNVKNDIWDLKQEFKKLKIETPTTQKSFMGATLIEDEIFAEGATNE